MGFPGGSEVRDPPASAGDVGSISGLGRKWKHTPIFLSGKSHGQRSMAGYKRVKHSFATKQLL